jgi:hypothetical protein
MALDCERRGALPLTITLSPQAGRGDVITDTGPETLLPASGEKVAAAG